MAHDLSVLMSPAKVSGKDNPYVPILINSLADLKVHCDAFEMHKRPKSSHIFHVHWLERFFQTRLASRSNVIASIYRNNILDTAKRVRDAGGRVVWTAHNLSPHGKLSPKAGLIWQKAETEFFPLVTDVLTLFKGAETMIKSDRPVLTSANFTYVAHHHYEDFFRSTSPDVNIIKHLNLPETKNVALIFGYLKPYKRVVETIKAFKSVYMDDWSLVVAGKTTSSYAKEIRDAAAMDDRIILHLDSLSHSTLFSLLKRSRVCLFNFDKIFNSGSVMTALSTGCSVISRTAPSLRELQGHVGEDWVQLTPHGVTPNNIEKLLNSVVTSLSERPVLEHFSPSSVAARHVQAYSL